MKEAARMNSKIGAWDGYLSFATDSVIQETENGYLELRRHDKTRACYMNGS